MLVYLQKLWKNYKVHKWGFQILPLFIYQRATFNRYITEYEDRVKDCTKYKAESFLLSFNAHEPLI